MTHLPKKIENQKSNYTDYTIFFWPKTVFEKKETVNAFIRKYLGIGTLIKLINYCTWVFNYNNRNFVNGQYIPSRHHS